MEYRSLPEPVMLATADDGKDIILSHLRQRLNPVFRRRGMIYFSESLGREVGRTDSVVALNSALRDKLKEATDVPRDKEGGVKTEALPRFFTTWLPTAWADLLDGLLEEEASAEIADAAQDEFREKVAAGFHTIVSHGRYYEKDKSTEVEARSLIDWCVLWAQGRQMEEGPLLAHLDQEGLEKAPADDPAHGLRIAIRSGLFRQTRSPDLAALTQRKFGMLAELYDVGTSCRAGRIRNTELVPGFIASLLDTSNQDGRPDSPAPNEEEQPREEE